MRKVIIPQTAETIKKIVEKEDTLHKLADRTVLEKRTASGRHWAKTEVSDTVKATNIRDAPASISYLIKISLTALTTSALLAHNRTLIAP